MKKDWHNLDLRNSTIFDLTDDKDLLKSILMFDYTEDEYKNTQDNIRIACDMMVYAIEKKDIELQNKLKVIFKLEYDLYEEFMIE